MTFKKTLLKTLAVTTVVGAVMAMSSVVAMAEITHTFTAPAEGVSDGTIFDKGYFTAVGEGAHKSSSSTDTIELTKNGGNYIKFTPEGTATVKVSFASTNSTNESQVDLCGTDKLSIESATVTGNTCTEKTFTTSLKAGTTYLIANLGDGRSTCLASIIVTETDTASYPEFENLPSTDVEQEVDLSGTASKDMGLESLQSAPTLTGSADKPYDDTTFPGFSLYGKMSSGTFKAMTINYKKNDGNFEGKPYDYKLKTGGVGNTTEDCIVFEVEKDSTIVVIGQSDNASSNRPLVLSNGTEELAKHVFVGSSLSKAEFTVTAGKYYLYAGDAISGSNGGVNLFSLKIFDGHAYKLPVVTLENSGVVDENLQLKASVNKDYTSGEITAIGFIIGNADAGSTIDTADTNAPCKYYTEEGDNFVFIGQLEGNPALKAQAYVKYTSEADQSEKTRYSNTVVNVPAA